MANADITKYSSIKLDYLFCIIGIITAPHHLKKILPERQKNAFIQQETF
jgi:hypothetical protein